MSEQREFREWTEPLSGEDAVRHISVILAAYSEKFPQLRGKSVPPNERDDRRDSFARQLVERLKLSRITFVQSRTDRPLMMNTGQFMPPLKK